MVGQDLLSTQNSQIVALRTSGYFITPEYTSYGGQLYYTKDGTEITNPDNTTEEKVKAIREAAAEQLKVSDEIQTGDLLRFDTDNGLKTVDTSKINYAKAMSQMKAIEKKLGDKSTSLYSQNGNKSTQSLFNAPSYLQLSETVTSSSTSSTSESESSSTSSE